MEKGHEQVAWCRRAIAHGQTEMLGLFSKMYLDGDYALTKSGALAYVWASRAMEKGYSFKGHSYQIPEVKLEDSDFALADKVYFVEIASGLSSACAVCLFLHI